MGIENYSAPYTPPPIDPDEPEPIPNKNSGIHTSFSILYNWHTGCFQIGNAVFEDSDEGFKRMSAYLKHFTPKPTGKPVQSTNLPGSMHAPHKIKNYMPKVPKHVKPKIDEDFLSDLMDGPLDLDKL